VDEKVRAVADLTRDDEVASQVATDLLKRPAVTEHVTPAERVRVVTELTRDDTVAKDVTSSLLRRPAVARTAMRDDTTRMLVNRAQFDNSNETRDRIRERTPAVRAIEHTIEYLDLVGSCHGFVATLGRLVPRLRGQEFTEDERETVRRQIGRVRAAADWLEGALDNGEFTLVDGVGGSHVLPDRAIRAGLGQVDVRDRGGRVDAQCSHGYSSSVQGRDCAVPRGTVRRAAQ
jgi:hypothetical protein